MARAKNPSSAGLAVAAILAGVVLVGYKLFGNKTRAAVAKPSTVYDAWKMINIEAAMPTLSDFPQGWTLHNEGEEGGGTGNKSWALSWRVLKLNAPGKYGETWVAVISAQAKTFSSVGWGGAHSEERAYEQIEQKRRGLHESVGQ
jgi:hypothetical protein